MTAGETKDDKINTLCKMYFTPEKCKESISESRRTLEIKLIAQLQKFAQYLFNHSGFKRAGLPNGNEEVFEVSDIKPELSRKTTPLLENAKDLAIAECFSKWRQDSSVGSYAAYFKTSFFHQLSKILKEDSNSYSGVSGLENLTSEIKKLCKQYSVDFSSENKTFILEHSSFTEKEIDEVFDYHKMKATDSLDEPVSGEDSDKNTTMNDLYKDPDAEFEITFESRDRAQEYIDLVDKTFRLKNRNNWYKSLLTGTLYDALHDFYDANPHLRIQKLSFIDMEIYDWKTAPEQKKIADYLGKDPGQINKALKNFLEPIKELFASDYEKMKQKE